MARWLGVDVGATTTKIAVVDDEQWSVTDRASAPTDRTAPERTVAACADLVRDWVERIPALRGVGVTLPGHIDPETGFGVVIPNIPGDWRGVPVTGPLRTAAGRPIAIINDARAFVLAESRLGAGRGVDDVLGIVLGTGVGGGVLIGGRLFTGRSGNAGEVGHQVLVRDGPPCGCGNRGCLEALARADVIAAAAGHATVAGAAAAAADGDERARSALREAGAWIGLGLANLVTVLTPEVVVIGGGVALAGDPLMKPLVEQLRASSPLVPPESYRVLPAELGPFAGAVGAAVAASDTAP
ncbi:ROK family protein [Pseudactinotalea sp. Z1739]|uniref:ROK family protein n=1 Tax=Pseudactinotalea sp. Z1739 TaxID=3413028 RepID=UPI003C7D197A